MNEQKGYWGAFETLGDSENEGHTLLSELVKNKNLKGDSSLFAFIKGAIRYFASKSEAFRTYFNDSINNITDYIKLIEHIEKYSASTPEEKVLKC